MTTTIWATPLRCPLCPDCHVDLLPQISADSLVDPMGAWTPRRGEFWCPACKGEFLPKFKPTESTGAGFIVHPEPHGAAVLHRKDGGSIKLRVEPDGMVAIFVNGGEPAYLTMAQIAAVSSAAVWLSRGAQTRQQKLRGADQWVFSQEGGARRVSHMDERCDLEGYTVGRVKGGTVCWRCRYAIAVGAPAYRPVVLPSQRCSVTWKTARFCPSCVEAGAEAKVRGPLRMIDGGKG